MSLRMIAAFMFLAAVPVAKGEVVVELVPDNPGPYAGGESLTVDVWLHSEGAFDAYLWLVQFDFSDSDRALVLDSTFTFDLSSSATPDDFEVHPELPIPWTANGLEYGCAHCRLQLPAGGSLHIGSLGLRLATEGGTYRLDALNAADPDPVHGARIIHGGTCCWRAFTGEITGGSFDFVVTPPIPTLSEWSLIVMTLTLLALGCLIITRRNQGANDRVFPTTNARLSLRSGICSAGLALGVTAPLMAEAPVGPAEMLEVSFDSGIVF